ncbi:tetratricopeptide repeat protein [Streptomyces sp. NPDC059499]|uniref:tetratricopeptide repeat protein n=1 Tax=Streptomyces sp. NPDC059499 TaxID=3346852 RepID=UPI00369B2691
MTRRDRALETLRQHSELADLAAFPFGFDLDRAEHVEAVRLASGTALQAVAGDDTGGTYFLCSNGEVLYAGSDGEAGLVGDSVDEALEVLIGLPGWRDYTDLDLQAGTAELTAVIARTEETIRNSYAPQLDHDRSRLLAGLGLSRLPQLELVRRLHQSLLRTEPDFMLLNADEGCAYTLLDRLPRPPLWRTVLAPGQADLLMLRSDRTCWDEVVDDPGRRATLLRSAQYDRRTTDLPLLRTLLRAEAQLGHTQELTLAAVLVGLHGHVQDYELMQSLRMADSDVHHALGGFPEGAEGLRAWATAFDVSNYGQDPTDEDALTWADLARRQGRTELARSVLVRLLDDAGPRDAPLLGRLAGQLATLGDYTQAARARKLHASLQDDPEQRGALTLSLAVLQRRAGDVEAAWQSLQRAVAVLDGPPPEPPTDQLALDLDLDEQECQAVAWRSLQLGQMVTEEHFLVARAAATTGLAATARTALAAGTAVMGTLTRPTDNLRGLAHAMTEESEGW